MTWRRMALLTAATIAAGLITGAALRFRFEEGRLTTEAIIRLIQQTLIEPTDPNHE